MIEGFYGPPWSVPERAGLFESMAAWEMNTYLYAPKDDLKHRSIWRELYDAGEIQMLREVVAHARRYNIRFIHALAPGLDIRYADPADFDRLVRRVEQMLDIGCGDFALLFDDIPDQMRPEDRARWPSFAQAQCDLTNRLYARIRARAPETSFLFCPTPYCGRMAERGLGGAGYLDTVGMMLTAGIQVLWTGPEIISREITVEHLRAVAARLRRKPVLWDNLHANDYDGRRFFLGPYSGRPLALRREVSGILMNPNSEYPLNFVAMRTCAEFARAGAVWDPREAYLRAMRDELPRFAVVGRPISFEDLVLLGDAYYLPHEDGPEARRLFSLADALLSRNPVDWEPAAIQDFVQGATRLRDCCARLSELRDRPLFHALHRRVWELREELDLLLGYVRLRSDPGRSGVAARSDFHLPGTYRGSFVARLQSLLSRQSDGSFVPSHRCESLPRS